jgi:hypothetical protein
MLSSTNARVEKWNLPEPELDVAELELELGEGVTCCGCGDRARSTEPTEAANRGS